MGHPPPGFTMVSQRKYAEYARALGMIPLGTQLVINNKVVGWRTNKRVYVDPTVYERLFGKRPAVALPSEFDSMRYESRQEVTPSCSDPNTIKCPTCRHSVPFSEGQIDFKCTSCGTAFRY